VTTGARRALATLAVVGGAGLGVIGVGSPAAADPARPTEYRSTVDEVSPSNAGVDVRVRGGDAFLEITVTPGHEVIVPGYEGEPYVRVLEDGTVERNRLSPATAINEARYGTEPPADADADADPEWERVGDGGRYAWHDHRVHWMSPDPPPADPGEVVFDWTVPLSVDGEPVEVRGRLERVAGVSPVPWVVGAAVVAAALLAFCWRRPPRTAVLVASGALLVVGIVATVLGAAEWSATPAGVRSLPVLIALPVATCVLAGGALAMALSRRVELACGLAMGGVALLAGWVFVRLSVPSKPVLPTQLPAVVDRAGLALALGTLVAASVTLVRAMRGLRPPASSSP
jgi:hypothetical protein